MQDFICITGLPIPASNLLVLHRPLHTASGGIIRILDYFSSFAPPELTSINMTTPAEKGRRKQSQLHKGGWCDVGRRGREERKGGREERRREGGGKRGREGGRVRIRS